MKIKDRMVQDISVVEHLADMPMALGSVPSTEKKVTYF